MLHTDSETSVKKEIVQLAQGDEEEMNVELYELQDGGLGMEAEEEDGLEANGSEIEAKMNSMLASEKEKNDQLETNMKVNFTPIGCSL